MAIKIIDEPDLHITKEEYERYAYEYQRSYMMYVGPVPSLETYIRQRKQKYTSKQEMIQELNSRGGI